jgi:GntR family transcriptional repressor for pyruvate dehydrogenase complex
MKSFYDLLFYGIKTNLQYLYTEPATLASITQHHKNILKAVRDRDPDAAYSAMREHIVFVLDFVHQKNIA